MKKIAIMTCLLVLTACSSDSDSQADNGSSLEVSELSDADKSTLNQFFNIDFDQLDNYADQTLPAYYFTNNVTQLDNTPINNPVDDAGATVGRILFYDKALSVNNTIACSSCHVQSIGFTDSAQLSQGFEGGQTGAHSMRLGNIKYYPEERMFWDKRADSIEDQSTQPIQDSTEMGFDLSHGGFDALVTKLNASDYYPILFQWVFDSPEITEERVQLLLSQFLRSMISSDSKFDQGYAQVYNPTQQNGNINAAFPNFSNEEERGKNLFMNPPSQGGGPRGAGCSPCHSAPTFSSPNNVRSNGLDAGETTVFKSPSLKNVALSGPYMHDGRFNTLEQVIEHYNSGILDGPALDNRLGRPNNQTQQLNLSVQEKADLVAFLSTLNDTTLINDAKFASPFSE